MNSKPDISVVMPTYNRAHTLSKAIESILGQSFENFELIIVDDGSTDETRDVADNISDPRVRFFFLSENGGASNARNIGIKNATADYIAFLDSDDQWKPDKLKKQFDLIKNCDQKVGVVYSGFTRYDGDKVLYMPDSSVKRKSGNIFYEILKRNFITFQTLIAKKGCFEKSGLFDESLRCRHDWDLLIRLSRDWDFLCIDEPLVDIYAGSDSISKTHKVDMAGWKPIIEKYIDEFEKHPAILANHYMRIATWSMPTDKEDFYQRRGYMFRALKTFPFVNYKYLVLFLFSLLGSGVYNLILRTINYGKNR
ncbi:glycosyltransferase family 2 protein [Planctomycetota bacterium]